MSLDKEHEKRLHAAALNRLHRLQVRDCFDPIDLNSRPTPKQEEIFKGILTHRHRYIIAGNQGGKTSCGAREVSWLFEDNHPFWSRPKEWGTEPLLIIVVGRVGKQIEDSIWPKIRGFLDPACYKETRSGGALQKITNTKNGNTILFASHHADNEAREKLQSFVAHYVWVDEMPGSTGIIEELHRRVQARNGYFIATFTPKVKNDEMRKFVDAQKPPLAKIYRLAMFDNPIYTAERQDAILSSLQGLSESARNSILYGDWIQDTNTVYEFDYNKMVVTKLPSHYSPGWRHVEAVDPALKSKFGFILLAEDPSNGIWYVVKATYFSGIFVPREMVEEVQKHTNGYNIMRRVSDPHEPWYIHTASDMKVSPPYSGVPDKHNRKGELIKNLQSALGTTLFIASWCTDLIDEFMEMRWSESQADTIVNARSYHLNDALQYGLDILPKFEGVKNTDPWYSILRQQHEERKAAQAAAKQVTEQKKGHWKVFKLQRTSKRWR